MICKILKDVRKLPLISIVDDDESVRKSLLRLLRSEGLSAEAFASAEDFLDSYYLNHAACLILDVRMPGMSGLELQDLLIAINKRIPIIFLSAVNDEEAQARALEAVKDIISDSVRAVEPRISYRECQRRVL